MTTEAANTEELLKNIADELSAKPYVYSASVWNGRRVYVNLLGGEASFAGDRNLKAYYDTKLGWVFEGYKGTMSDKFQESFEAFREEYKPARR